MNFDRNGHSARAWCRTTICSLPLTSRVGSNYTLPTDTEFFTFSTRARPNTDVNVDEGQCLVRLPVYSEKGDTLVWMAERRRARVDRFLTTDLAPVVTPSSRNAAQVRDG